MTAPPRYRLAHLSDVHFGKIAHPGIVEALVDEVNAADMDLVVVSGDLTQRAHDHEFEAARAMLDAFTAPTLVVPGNHDVRQFWHNPVERVRTSTTRFERFISPDLTPSFVADGLAAFGMNTAHGLTIKGGLVRVQQVEAMQAFFAAQPAGAFRMLVVHHHLIPNGAVFGRTDISRNAVLALGAVAEARVDLILCGHYHISNATAHTLGNGHTVVVASAGTATSSRGRGDNKADNVYNWITVDAERFEIEERRFEAEVGAFSAMRTSVFDR